MLLSTTAKHLYISARAVAVALMHDRTARSMLCYRVYCYTSSLLVYSTSLSTSMHDLYRSRCKTQCNDQSPLQSVQTNKTHPLPTDLIFTPSSSIYTHTCYLYLPHL